MATAVKGRARKTGTATKNTTKASVKNAPRPKAAAAKTATTKAKPRAKKVVEPVEEHTPRPRVFGLHGYVENSDSAIIAEELVKGGASRGEVNEAIAARIEETNGLNTRGGKPKNVASLTSAILRELIDKRGYAVESSFVVVPPAEVLAEVKKADAAKKRAATRAARKKG